MAWEWKVPLPSLRDWPYTDFAAALQALTDSRWSDVRRSAMRESAGVADLKSKLR